MDFPICILLKEKEETIKKRINFRNISNSSTIIKASVKKDVEVIYYMLPKAPYITRNLFITNPIIEQIFIPPSVKINENNAFKGCQSLKPFTIPSSVT